MSLKVIFDVKQHELSTDLRDSSDVIQSLKRRILDIGVIQRGSARLIVRSVEEIDESK